MSFKYLSVGPEQGQVWVEDTTETEVSLMKVFLIVHVRDDDFTFAETGVVDIQHCQNEDWDEWTEGKTRQL